MKPVECISSLESSAVGSMSSRSLLAREYEAELMGRLEREGPRALAAFVNEHPQIAENESLVFELVSEMVRWHQERGRPIDSDEVFRWFPSLEKELRKGILLEGFIEEHHDLVQQVKAKVKRPDPMGSFPGFLLLEELGKGGAARVYLAAERALGDRPVVLKIAQNGAGEAHVLGRLQHPNIVPIYSVHTDSGSELTAVCMPYLSSATLLHALRVVAGADRPPQTGQVFINVARDRTRTPNTAGAARTPDPVLRRRGYPEAVAHLGAQLADALAHAHTRGVFHRDLKPSNVLLGLDGRPMLMDFNLAADVNSAQRVKGGTLPYMAPEQHQALFLRNSGSAPLVDARSDIFSLGVILYELLTGSLPFPVVELPQWRGKMSSGELLAAMRQVRPLQERCPQIDKQLAGIVQRCLAYDPDDRPQTGAEVAGILRHYLAVPQRTRRWVKRHVRALTAATLLTTVLTTSATAYVATRPTVVPPTLLEQGWEAFRNNELQKAGEFFRQAIERESACDEAYFGRGRVFVREKRWIPALEHFEQANKIRPNPRYMACSAYCIARSAPVRLPEASELFRTAAQNGFETAIVLNNTGYCYRKINALDEAEMWLQKAVAVDPRLQAAWHNLLELHTRKACRSVQSPSTFQHAWLTDIARAEAALYGGKISPYMFADAARLFALAPQTDERYKAESLRYLELAIRNGLPANALLAVRSDECFACFKNDTRFHELLVQPASLPAASEPELLLDPIQE